MTGSQRNGESSHTKPASFKNGSYAPVPAKFLQQETITSFEGLAKQLPKDDTNNLRGHVCGILRSTRLPKDNIKKVRMTGRR
ncbi:MAG: hypothetical protein MJE68_28640 [Proteobacteria bacterium]|nr:hypothetical protein [Pseudomonadota bacterium]